MAKIENKSFKEFIELIKTKKFNDEQIFQKYFVDNKTFFFEQTDIEENLEYALKHDISAVLKTHLNDIYIVGSAKTGFSIKPNCRGRIFDEKYNITKQLKDKSDVDIAIVSTQCFDFIQENIYDWSNAFKKNWDSNSFYNNGTQKFGVSLKFKFLEYLGKGWYRPDLAPQDYILETPAGKILTETTKWRKILDRKISFAIYKNWHFFKKYQMENIAGIRAEIASGNIL